MNAQDLIELSYSEIRVKKLGYDLSGEEMQLGLALLNALLEEWEEDSLMIPYRTREELTLTAGLAIHTIGTGGNLNTVRPVSVELMKLQEGGVQYEVDVVSLQRFERECDQVSTGTPAIAYYEPVDPLGRLYLHPVPAIAYHLILHSLKPFTAFATLLSDEAVPNGYKPCIQNNLTVRLAPHFGKEASKTTTSLAMMQVARIKARNAALRVPTMVVDGALLPSASYNIISG